MHSGRRTATVLGVLYLAIMSSWTVRFGLIHDVLGAPTYLADAYPRQNQILLGTAFELGDAVGVLLMVAVVVPLLRAFDETVATIYLVFRVIEAVLLVAAALCTLAVITLSGLAQDGDPSPLEPLGQVCNALRIRWIQLALPCFCSAAKIPVFICLWKTRLLPRAISGVRLLCSTLVLTCTPLDFLQLDVGLYVGAAMGLTEIVLGF